MVLRGLSARGLEDLAYEIAINHHASVVASFEATGSVWEHHAPDLKDQGRGRKDFVGWTGITPIAVFLEYVLGLRPAYSQKRLSLHVRGNEGFSVERYPFGPNGSLDVRLSPRASLLERPKVEIRSNLELELELIWAGNREIVPVSAKR
jgi:hypothetical protein